MARLVKCLSTSRFKEDRAQKSRKRQRKKKTEKEDCNTIYVMFGIVLQQQKKQNLGAGRGVWHVRVSGKAVAGLCARFASTIK